MESNSLEKNLLDIAVETYRFSGVFERVIAKLGYDDQSKYMSQYNWFYKKVLDALSDAGFQYVQLKGQKYDPGIAAIPVNLDDFDENDDLQIVQVIEPTIIRNGEIVKMGSVVVGRKS